MKFEGNARELRISGLAGEVAEFLPKFIKNNVLISVELRKPIEEKHTAMPEACVYCNSKEIKRQGKEYLKNDVLQVFQCLSCKRKFTFKTKRETESKEEEKEEEEKPRKQEPVKEKTEEPTSQPTGIQEITVSEEEEKPRKGRPVKFLSDVQCPECKSHKIRSRGKRYSCSDCGKWFDKPKRSPTKLPELEEVEEQVIEFLKKKGTKQHVNKIVEATEIPREKLNPVLDSLVLKNVIRTNGFDWYSLSMLGKRLARKPRRKTEKPKREREPSIKEKVLYYLKKKKKATTTKIADALEKPVTSISPALTTLTRLGVISRTKQGIYEYVGTTESDKTKETKEEEERKEFSDGAERDALDDFG